MKIFTKNELLAITSGIILAFSFPPLKFGFLGCIALVPLLLSLNSTPTGNGFRQSYIMGIFLHLFSFYWILELFVPFPVKLLGYLALSLYEALFIALFGWTISLVPFGFLRILLIPVFWTGMEFIRSYGILGFPWLDLAYTQTNYPRLFQFIEFTGAQGLSFWVVSMNSIIYGILCRKMAKKRIFFLVFFIILLFIPLIHGTIVINNYPKQVQENGIKVSLIQGNIDPEKKWNENFKDFSFDVFIEDSEKASQEFKPDMIIWPETATPCYLIQNTYFKSKVQNLARKINSCILTGTPDYENFGNEKYSYYNSAVLFDQQGKLINSYNKIHLVPFGEMIPLDNHFEILKRINLGEGDFTPGDKFTIFQNSDYNFATIICFESIFQDLVRQFVNNGADFLVIITNDCWFGKSQAPYMHAMISVLRAAELRSYIARCANTGISMFINPLGIIQKKSGIFTREIISDVMYKKEKLTFFAKYGNIIGKISFFILLIYTLLITVKIRFLRRKNA